MKKNYERSIKQNFLHFCWFQNEGFFFHGRNKSQGTSLERPRIVQPVVFDMGGMTIETWRDDMIRYIVSNN